MRNLAQIFSISKTAKFLKSVGVDESKKTPAELMSQFQEACMIVTVPRYSRSARGIVQMPRKVYPVDVGLFQPFLSVAESLTHRFESLVAIHLYKQHLLTSQRVYYWQGQHGREVDFVVEGRRGVETLVQVCYDATDGKTRQRKEQGLVRASRELGCKNLTVITWDTEEVVERDNLKIQYVTFLQWIKRHDGA